MDVSLILKLNEEHKKLEQAKFTYGTAGFRTLASTLDPVLFRVGLLASLRSKKLNSKFIGAMITASHNAAPVKIKSDFPKLTFKDNGVKLVEPLGEMLVQTWEPYATKLANAETREDIVACLTEIIETEKIDLTKQSNVAVARDTRPSGEKLVESLKDGVISLHGNLTNFGVLTTPQLHYNIRCLNTKAAKHPYGEVGEEHYYKKLSDAYKSITRGFKKLSPLYVDAANGVGAKALLALAKEIGSEYFDVFIVNADVANSEKLNFECGADFVKLKQKAPTGLELKSGMRCASLDGDADRIVYYYADHDGKFKLLDGDKIATLAAGFIMDLVRKANVTINGQPPKFGLVQTAYANGSSTEYASKKMQVPVVFTMTGVKHLHHAAEEFDIGVYFEANGHGTVLFSENVINAFSDVNGKTEEEIKSLNILKALSIVINQAVGDALSDMLMVELILTLNKQSLSDWDEAYTDLPSRQIKVKVSDRHIFKPIKADTELLEPLGLQEKINAEVKKYSSARSFVRPSGTEDVVRVYCEAKTQKDVDELSVAICTLVFDGYGGIGERTFI
ncbi:Phosphoacetylglucosamine Mutase [Clydaea vesicula]|uniref:Phosphoacetylglucosamine mutase n=1 Tax=Clydaea vesicula TaxID=447962 RepID=A0AAD5U0V6_9FUNG|nr:Phosphoacetylglucosamine Mutase [Clydaea vesicula]